MQGLMATGVTFTLFAWCIRMRGPLFVSAFSPLMVLIVALAGPLVLNETIHLGRYLHSEFKHYNICQEFRLPVLIDCSIRI